MEAGIILEKMSTKGSLLQALEELQQENRLINSEEIEPVGAYVLSKCTSGLMSRMPINYGATALLEHGR